MVLQGYLKFDENFNAQVTEKHPSNIRTAISMDKELQSVISGIYSYGNTIEMHTTEGGINKITLHWGGFRLYLCDFTIDEIVRQGTRATVWGAAVTALLALLLIPDLELTIILAGITTAIIGVGIFELNDMNRFDTGLRFCFNWIIPLPPAILPFTSVPRVSRQR